MYLGLELERMRLRLGSNEMTGVWPEEAAELLLLLGRKV